MTIFVGFINIQAALYMMFSLYCQGVKMFVVIKKTISARAVRVNQLKLIYILVVIFDSPQMSLPVHVALQGLMFYHCSLPVSGTTVQ